MSHPAADDAALQALAAAGFPQRWQQARRCVLLQPVLGDGSGLLAAWCAWRQAQPPAATQAGGKPPAPAPGPHLVLVAIAPHPPSPETLPRLHAGQPWADLAARLAAAWPVPTPDLHLVALEPGVRLLLALGPRPWLRELRLQADVLLLWPEPIAGDGPAPAAPPQQVLRRLAAPGAVMVGTPGAEPPALRLPDAVPAAPSASPPPGRALVIGAGIAGASCAAALVRAGWACEVLEAADAPAQAASGNHTPSIGVPTIKVHALNKNIHPKIV